MRAVLPLVTFAVAGLAATAAAEAAGGTKFFQPRKRSRATNSRSPTRRRAKSSISAGRKSPEPSSSTHPNGVSILFFRPESNRICGRRRAAWI